MNDEQWEAFIDCENERISLEKKSDPLHGGWVYDASLSVLWLKMQLGWVEDPDALPF
jgi:hypothetical protein